MQEDKKKNRLYIIITVILSLILKLLTIFRNNNISMISDNIGDLALPTYLAGLDWSALIEEVSYYGYGFKWPYTLFFVLTDNPYIIHMSIKFFYIILNCILGAVIYRFVIKYWDIKRGGLFYAIWSAIVVSIATTSTSSENAVFMSFFILNMLLTKALQINTVSGKRRYSGLIAFWMCYMLTIHERCLAAILAFFIIAILWRISRKTWIVELKVFIPIFLVSYFVQELLTNHIIQFFWSTQSAAGTLKNTNAIPTKVWWFLSSFRNFKIFLDCAINNVHTLIIKTYGLGILAIIFGGIFLYNLFVKKNEAIQNLIDNNKSVIVMFLMSAITVLIIIVGLTISWGRSVANENPYGYKGYTYFRYYLPFAWPGILSVLLLWKQFTDKTLKKVMVFCAVFISLLTVYFAANTYPILMNAEEIRSVAVKRMGFFENIGSLNELASIIISIIITMIFISVIMQFSVRSFYIHSIMTILLIIFINTKGFHATFPSVGCSSFDASYDAFKQIEKTEELPGVVYYYGGDPYNCQFMLNRYSIYHDWPADEENAIIFSNLAPDLLNLPESEVYAYCMLNDNEYLYLKGNDYFHLFEDSGLKLSFLQ